MAVFEQGPATVAQGDQRGDLAEDDGNGTPGTREKEDQQYTATNQQSLTSTECLYVIKNVNRKVLEIYKFEQNLTSANI